jgi:flagellar protein FliJ
MPRFIFKLDGVLRQRKHIERQRQRDLALVQRQWQEVQAELRALNQSLQQSADDLRGNRLVGKLDLPYLAAYRRFTFAMQRKGQALVQRLAIIQRQVDAAQQALIEAAKRRKAIEKLRERHWERWYAEQSRKESAEVDEVGVKMWQMDVARDLAEEIVPANPESDVSEGVA